MHQVDVGFHKHSSYPEGSQAKHSPANMEKTHEHLQNDMVSWVTCTQLTYAV